MTEQIYCRIRVKGHLSEQWDDWFGGLKIENQPEGQALLQGILPDQTALYGVLDQMRNLGLALVWLQCGEYAPQEENTVPGIPSQVKQSK